MKGLLIIACMSIFYFNCFSQIKYEAGYLINNEGKKMDCLIKNYDWKNNPKEFMYKLTEGSQPQKAKIEDVSEFNIYNAANYKRFVVDIDRSSEDISHLSSVAEPEFNKEQLFLKTLVKGKATLYLYTDKGLVRYFFTIDSSNIKQLVYKKYVISDYSFGDNNTYKTQLSDNLNCLGISGTTIDKMKYVNRDMIKLFTAYNNCTHSTIEQIAKKEKRDVFNLTLRPGLSSSSLKVERGKVEGVGEWTFDFGNKLNFRMGIEAEVILPFNKNKWAITIEPTYTSYKSSVIALNKTNNVDYKTIEVPLGLRYSSFITDKSKLFINGLFVYSNPLKSTLIVRDNGFEVSSGYSFAMGVGYVYNKKYNLEFRYESKRNLTNWYANYIANYQAFSVILGYTIF